MHAEHKEEGALSEADDIDIERGRRRYALGGTTALSAARGGRSQSDKASTHLELKGRCQHTGP